ncbi:MAG: DUF177 domain-containing protein [Dehalococcoidia bacterium]|nr:DUF177 domain-containing protein [Dehalococcoidia bacterium]
MLTAESLSGDPIQARYSVGSLLQQPVGTQVTHDIADILTREQSSLVSGHITFTHTNRGIALSGEGEADVRMMCMRCLDEFAAQVAFTIEEQVHPDPRYAHRRGAEGFEEDDEPGIREDNTLDLGEIIRQHIVLHLPIKPLCRRDCPGIKELNPDG